MSIGKSMLPEFDQEMASTRRVLERVPSEKGQWKPHPKSFALGHLAQLVAVMPGWLTQTIRGTEIDLATSKGYSFEKTKTLVDLFDRNVREAREAFASARDEDFDAQWSLKHGERVLLSGARGPVVRSHINHLIHHRAQLTVYLRLLDVAVPGMYGPTADEPWQ
jgi:uncharacterized damage-inducible protein DinB